MSACVFVECFFFFAPVCVKKKKKSLCKPPAENRQHASFGKAHNNSKASH